MELKCNELRHVRRVKVRQKSTLMPAAKSLLHFGNGWFPIPLPFVANKFEQAKILRR